MPKILITTIPFADKNNLPLELLKSVGAEVTINPIGRKLKEEELVELVGDYDILIAGTEPITSKVLHKAKKLKLISRVGIGLDSVDLAEAKKRGILVSYTPDAPAPAVAELTMGLMLSLLRNIHLSNIEMHRGQWYRYFGRRIPEITIGVIGVGRIGGGVLRRLSSFGTPRTLVNDIFPNHKEGTRNFSRLLSNTSIWNLEKFIVLDLFPILQSFERFKENTRFTIICVEFLLRILDEPNIEDNKLDILLNDRGKSIFCYTK